MSVDREIRIFQPTGQFKLDLKQGFCSDKLHGGQWQDREETLQCPTAVPALKRRRVPVLGTTWLMLAVIKSRHAPAQKSSSFGSFSTHEP